MPYRLNFAVVATPHPDAIRELRVGDRVKVPFVSIHDDTEDLWVKINSVNHTTDLYTGTLAETPKLVHDDLAPGDPIMLRHFNIRGLDFIGRNKRDQR